MSEHERERHLPGHQHTAHHERAAGGRARAALLANGAGDIDVPEPQHRHDRHEHADDCDQTQRVSGDPAVEADFGTPGQRVEAQHRCGPQRPPAE